MLEQFVVVAAAVVILALYAGRRANRRLFRSRMRPWHRLRWRRLRLVPSLDRDLTDLGEQLRAVMAAPFQKQKLLSLAEYRVFKIIEDDLAGRGGGYRLFAQANLGEILRSPDDNAYRSINSKRVDILLVNGGGWPVLAIEYQGRGHYQGEAAARDAIKKEALRKAGVAYVEITDGDTDEQIRARVRDRLGWSQPAPGRPFPGTNPATAS